MKNVLFIGVTAYNFYDSNANLQKKFEGLSEDVRVFVIARGKPFYNNVYNSFFYLIPGRAIYLPTAFLLGIYLCITKKIDTLVCQGPLTEGIVGVLLKILFKKELIIEIHGDWREGPFINKKRLFSTLLRRIVPGIAYFSLSRADKIRGVAEYFLAELRQKYPTKKYFVFPTYSDLSIFFAEQHSEFKEYICTVAVLSPIKNTKTLIDAFSKIHSQFPGFKLIIVGDGPSKKYLQFITHNLQLSDSIIFTGKLSLSEVKDVMRDCYVFVLPSLSEGVPRVLIEAMALAKPVIASNVGGIPEIVRDGATGFLVKPKDSDTLAVKLKILLGSSELAVKMGKSGRALASENFSNEKYLENYITMINK